MEDLRVPGCFPNILNVADDPESVLGDHSTWQPRANNDNLKDAGVINPQPLSGTGFDQSHHGKGNYRSRRSDPSPFDREAFQQHQARENAEPQPAPGSFGHIRIQHCTNGQCHCSTLRQELGYSWWQLADVQRRLEECQRELRAVKEDGASRIGSLEIELFHSVKDAKKYAEVERLYRNIVTTVDLDTCEDPVILDVRSAFVESLMEQERLQEAEEVSRAVWLKRKRGLPSEDTMWSHRQLCKVLFALRNFKEASNLQRKMWIKDPKDEWALENGDELCKTLSAQGEYEEAKMEQNRVWNARETWNGPRHRLTVESGLRKIELHEKLLPISTEIDKQSIKAHIKEDLERIWRARLQPGPENADYILDAGRRLADICMSQGEFAEAEACLANVWEGQQSILGETNVQTMSTGTTLGHALKRQADIQKQLEAVDVFRRVWNAKKSVLKHSDKETVSSATDLASVYTSLQDWVMAESIYRWILDQRRKKQNGRRPDAVMACYDLGQAMFKQGETRYHDAEPLLKEAYSRWKISSPERRSTLECGRMVAEILSVASRASGERREALDVMRDVFDTEEARPDKDISYWLSGRLYGSLLSEAQEVSDARKVLERLWTHPTKTPQEQAMALECGRLYGQSLLLNQHSRPNIETLKKAKVVFEQVLSDQQDKHPNDVSEIISLQNHLQEVREMQDRVSAIKIAKVRPINGRKGVFARTFFY